MTGATTLLIGTTKGAFVIAGDAAREKWSVEGPFCDGWPVNHVVGDPQTGRVWAAGGSDWHGAGVWCRNGPDADWTLSRLAHGQMEEWIAENAEEAAQFGLSPSEPAPFTGKVDALWSLGLANGTVYAGAKPAALFASNDGGESWSEIDALSNHPTREEWMPGGAGLVLHTIIADPEDAGRLWIAISAAGVFATEDGGASWERRNRRSNVRPAGQAGNDIGPDDEVNHCVHNLVRARGAGDLLYQQNHQGVFRSPDGGRSWEEITTGLPSDFGFPVAVHPADPETLWVLPLNGDVLGRFPPDAAAAVWRSRDGGQSWSAARDGLPQTACFFTVLRQAMAVDAGEPAGVYFGTNSGSVFASADEGKRWTEIARHLPTVLSVETMAAAQEGRPAWGTIPAAG